jgi:hypothetical protein
MKQTMMKRYLDIVSEEGMIFPTLELLDNKHFRIKRAIVCLRGVDKEGYYHLLIGWSGSTRFVLKDVVWLDHLHKDLEIQLGHAIKNLHLWLPHAPLCSKAKSELSHNSWRMYHDPM